MTFSTPFSKFLFFFFFFNDTATTEIYTLSLHDALPIYLGPERGGDEGAGGGGALLPLVLESAACERGRERGDRSEEHTSELQSPCNLVCRLLLEKKKKTIATKDPTNMLRTINTPTATDV